MAEQTDVDTSEWRPEWRFAFCVVLCSLGSSPPDEGLVMLARETLRLWELAEVKYELLASERGFDVVEHLKPKIEKLYMQLNANARGDDADIEGDPIEQWNRLVGALATLLVHWMANARWAVLEHRQASHMRDALLNGIDVGPLGERPEVAA